MLIRLSLQCCKFLKCLAINNATKKDMLSEQPKPFMPMRISSTYDLHLQQVQYLLPSRWWQLATRQVPKLPIPNAMNTIPTKFCRVSLRLIPTLNKNLRMTFIPTVARKSPKANKTNHRAPPSLPIALHSPSPIINPLQSRYHLTTIVTTI